MSAYGSSWPRRIELIHFRYFAPLLLTLGFGGSRADAPPSDLGDPPLAAVAEAWLDHWVKSELEGAEPPPMAIALIFDGAVLVEKGYGRVDGRTTVFRAASLAKLITATAAMQLVERGRLRLDEPVTSWLPPGTDLSDEDPVPTLRDLLTHSSGIDDPMFGLVVPKGSPVPALADWLRAHPPRFGRRARRDIVYSNLGFGIVGLAVARASGVPFEEYVEREIFQPLRMTRSSFRQPYPPELASSVVPSGGDGVHLIPVSAGALITTAHDMGRFLAAHLTEGALDGRRVLEPQTARAMHTRAFAPHPALPGIGLGFFESDAGGHRGLFHTGASGHHSMAYLLPEERAGLFIVLSATSNGSPRLRSRLLSAFLDRWFPPRGESRATAITGASCEPDGATFRAIMLPRSRLEHVGEMALDTSVQVEANGGLSVALPPLGSHRLQLRPSGGGVFRDAEGYAAAFLCDDTRRTSRMTVTGPLFEPVSFERVRWFERGLVQAAAGAMLGLLWTAIALASIVRALRRSRPSRTPGRWAWRLGAAAAWAVLLAPAAALTVYFPGNPEQRPFKVGTAAGVACALLLASSVLAAPLPFAAALAWRKGWWSRRGRILFTAIAAGASLWIAWLAHWNLLGFRF